MNASPPPSPKPAPYRSPLATWLVSVAFAAAIGVLGAALLWQTQQSRDTNLLEAPTPAPMASAQLPAGAMPQPPPPRIDPQGSLPSRPPVGGIPQMPPRVPPTMPDVPAMPVAPIPAQPAPPEVSLPPSPTPTPELADSFVCRKGIYFDVKPDGALVTINGEPIGKANQWKEKDDAFELRREGVYFVRLSCPSCRPLWFKVTADDKADDKLVEIKARLRD